MPGPDKSPYAAITPSHWTLSIDRNEVADLAKLVAGDTRGLAEGYTMEFTFPRHEASVELNWIVDHKTPNPIPEGGAGFVFPLLSRNHGLRWDVSGHRSTRRSTLSRERIVISAPSTGAAITGADKEGVALCPLDSPLVSLDRPGLWKWSLDFVPQRPTVFINLYNNMWNTNFRFWQEGSWARAGKFWPLSTGQLR